MTLAVSLEMCIEGCFLDLYQQRTTELGQEQVEAAWDSPEIVAWQLKGHICAEDKGGLTGTVFKSQIISRQITSKSITSLENPRDLEMLALHTYMVISGWFVSYLLFRHDKKSVFNHRLIVYIIVYCLVLVSEPLSVQQRKTK